MTTEKKLDATFAAAVATILNPELQAGQIYTAAFADATKQIQVGLEAPKTLSGEIRARAAQLNELADLIDTTLAASDMPMHDSPSDDGAKHKGDKGEDGDGSPSGNGADKETPKEDTPEGK